MRTFSILLSGKTVTLFDSGPAPAAVANSAVVPAAREIAILRICPTPGKLPPIPTKPSSDRSGNRVRFFSWNKPAAARCLRATPEPNGAGERSPFAVTRAANQGTSMKRLLLISLSACALGIFTLSASAMPLATPDALVVGGDDNVILARGGHGHGGHHMGRGGRGHHYGWGRGRGHHYGWGRGRGRHWH